MFVVHLMHRCKSDMSFNSKKLEELPSKSYQNCLKIWSSEISRTFQWWKYFYTVWIDLILYKTFSSSLLRTESHKSYSYETYAFNLKKKLIFTRKSLKNWVQNKITRNGYKFLIYLDSYNFIAALVFLMFLLVLFQIFERKRSAVFHDFG